MTDTEKLELTNKALLELVYREEMDNFMLRQELNKTKEKMSALLKVEQNPSCKNQELQADVVIAERSTNEKAD